MTVKKAKYFPLHTMMLCKDPHGPNNVRQPYEDMYKHMHFKLPKSTKKAVRRNPATPLWNANTVSPDF